MQDVSKYPKLLDPSGDIQFNPFRDTWNHENPSSFDLDAGVHDCLDGLVNIPLPRRSLLVMFGQARYNWEHFIVRENIQSRRIVIAYRELTPFYLPGGDQEDYGKEVLEQARLFW